MNDSQVRSTDMVEVTDCLEAIGVFRVWKNLFAALLIAGLIVVQTFFWCLHQGWYEVKTIENAADPNATSQVIQQEVQEVNIIGRVAAEPKKWYAMTQEEIGRALNIINGVVLFSAFMYTLTLIFAMKVSILGRFGGINHICRAFYISLILLVLLIPWQEILRGYLVGAIYSYQDIQKGLAQQGEISIYLRFTMLWLVAFLLLIQAQSRTIRWARAILRRLEIL